MKKMIAFLLACLMAMSMTTIAFAEETQPSELSVGSILVFGNYEQDGDETNGKEPIEWIVLSIQGGKALLLSKDVLSATPYNKDNKPATWETCTLRSWLNEEFYNEAFSDEEKTAILITAVPNGIEEQYPIEIDYGSDTEDRVFLLSYREVRDYMKTDYLRCCQPSAALATYGKLNNWYTRSPGENTKGVRVVTANSGAIWTSWLNYKAAFPQQHSYNGVRPCVYVDLSSEPFHNYTERLVECENQFAELEEQIAALSTPSNDLIGKTIEFGNYTQDGNSTSPIEWIIIDVNEEYALLLSVNALVFRTYHSMDKAVTWEECSLRKWLNSEFMNAAFSENEITKIQESLICNGSDEGKLNNADSGNDSTDFVFLLSYHEAERYFPIDDMRECVPSPHAVQQGLRKDIFDHSSWWLRSTGETADEAMIVNKDGSRGSTGVNFGYGVRPAIWVSKDALGLQ